MSNIKNIGFGTSRLQLKKFPIEKMARYCTIAMVAKRASGKSYLTREIMYHKRKIPTVVISRTEKLNKFYNIVMHKLMEKNIGLILIHYFFLYN